MHRRAGRETRDAKIVGLREQGMTLAKIAEAVGVSDETVRRATASTHVEGRVAGRDGKEYPAHYAPRTRAAGFVAKHGRLVQVELDALPPNVLHALYSDALAPFRVKDRGSECQGRGRAALDVGTGAALPSSDIRPE